MTTLLALHALITMQGLLECILFEATLKRGSLERTKSLLVSMKFLFSCRTRCLQRLEKSSSPIAILKEIRASRNQACFLSFLGTLLLSTARLGLFWKSSLGSIASECL